MGCANYRQILTKTFWICFQRSYLHLPALWHSIRMLFAVTQPPQFSDLNLLNFASTYNTTCNNVCSNCRFILLHWTNCRYTLINKNGNLLYSKLCNPLIIVSEYSEIRFYMYNGGAVINLNLLLTDSLIHINHSANKKTKLIIHFKI